MAQAVSKISFEKNASAAAAAESGLSGAEAEERLQKFGSNDPVKIQKTFALVQFLLLFASPLVVILLIASALSAIVGNIVSSVIIFTMILLSVCLNFIQTSRSQRAAERLKREVSLTATVLRDGAWQETPRREVVPGDFIRLLAGDLVPADSKITEARDLHVQEAALTGESLPVEKAVGQTVFLGTSVASGTATAIVTETGTRTMFGKIAERLAEKAPETEFERGTRAFGFLIARVVVFLVLFVFLVNTFMQRDALESLLFSIALAVGLTPEYLPMITTVTLGRGAARMARQKVVVKHLAAIQNFGSMDVLCSDKTGTLTRGELTLAGHTDGFGNHSERSFFLAFLNSLHETGVDNALDSAIIGKANPLDAAILNHDRPNAGDYRKIDEIPFDFERRRVSIAVETGGGGGGRLLICKGAPEGVLAVCSNYEINGQIAPLTGGARRKCEQVFQDFSRRGLRVLAVAFAEISARKIYRDDERELVLAGFLTFADEPSETAADTLRTLAADGVEVKILTGDNELVARHICEQVGLDSGNIRLGAEIERMTDAALAHVAEQTTVFARVSPMQKTRILVALKSRGHVVGFLGDGINDAPSLRTADVGISVSNATDVAKDAAEIILGERSLRVLHNGIIEGRKSFGNVMKYLLMGTSSNFGNMFSMAGAAAFLPFLPMLPAQIILNNFLYDLAQITIPTDRVDRSFILKPHRWDVKLIRDFMLCIGPISSIYDFLTFYVLLRVFHATEQLFQTGWFVESLATQTLVVFIIRTAGNPFKSRPSLALTLTVLTVVSVAVILPFTPLAGVLGFTPLPLNYFLLLGGATVTYLALVEVVKRRLMRRLLK